MAILKILLAEDHPSWQKLLQRWIVQSLQDTGHTADIQAFQEFDAALSALDEDHWHLLVTDIGFGPHSEQKLGIRLAERAHDLTLPCVVVSGTRPLDPADVADLYERLGTRGFFWKNRFDPERFARTLQGIAADADRRERTPSSDRIIADNPNNRAVREWWHGILRRHGKCHCYAFFLALPSDKEIFRYLNEFGEDLQALSDENCLILSLSGVGILDDEPNLVAALKHEMTRGYSRKIARRFRINPVLLPCLIVFKSIHSPDHLALTFKGRTAEEIGESMRFIMGAIDTAVWKGNDPLRGLELLINRERRLKKSKILISRVGGFVEQNFATIFLEILKSKM